MPLSTRITRWTLPLACALVLALSAHAQEPVVFVEPDPSEFTSFGQSVAVDGDFLVIGAPGSRLAGYAYGVGAVYVYRRAAEHEWTLETALLPDLPLPFGGVSFGASVAIDGDVIAVGAPYEWMHLDMGGDAGVLGAAYIFRYVDGEWTREAKIAPPPFTSQVQYFGRALDIQGDHVVVGERGFGGSGSANYFPCFDPQGNTGGARVFTHQGAGEWVEQVRLEPIDQRQRADFGRDVALDGGRVIVGAPTWWDEDVCQAALANNGDPRAGTYRGQAYVYQFDGETWAGEAMIAQPEPQDGDQFGFAVGISGNTIIAGAPYSDEYGARFGGAYTYVLSGDEWAWEDSFVGFDTNINDRFGMAVDVLDDFAVVGAPFHNNANLNLGAMYAFYRVDGAWEEELQITIDEPTTDSPGPGWLNIGASVALGPGIYATGAPDDPRINGEVVASRVGSAYAYTAASLFNLPVSAEGGATPLSLRLRAPYPNPTAGTATVEFEMGAPGHASLTLYDVLGRRVAVLLDEERGEGTHRVAVDVSPLAAGVYLLRLEAGGEVQSRRLTRR